MRGDSAIAVVLITTEPGREHEVVKILSGLADVSEALLLFGEYDIFIKLECPDFGFLSDIVVNTIRNIEGVETTKTLTAAPIFD